MSPGRASKILAGQLAKDGVTLREVSKTLSELNFNGEDAASAAENIFLLPHAKRTNPESLLEALWPAYSSTAQKFCIQTAHVILARALLYRIGEDQDVFQRVLSGEDLVVHPVSSL